ncbi:hypothetical protein ED733_002704 [Metarhizium rileyi]|uniref:F-box domain-containing protein n=1 Tax=Metarhizium rileyi (strain RCEF 4871) TaxID=1649241 RepID=A0A5C6G1K5_METRR|nr:hypothetical protein ED733_002704 [Metarhizium rileyi]
MKYFGERTVIVSLKSLSHLGEIAEHPILAFAVRIIRVSVRRLPPFVDAFTYMEGNPDVLAQAIASTRSSTSINIIAHNFLSSLPPWTRLGHQTRCSDQRAIIESGALARFLRNALDKLPNCQTMVLTDGVGWGEKALVRESATSLVMDYPAISSDFTMRLWHAVLTAASASARVIPHVGIDFSYNVPDTLRLKLFRALMSDRQVNLENLTSTTKLGSFHVDHITTLTLAGVPSQGTWWGSSLVSLINMFPQLSQCSIDFGCIGQHGILREMSEKLYMPHIKVLALSRFVMQDEQLRRLLCRHGHTLQKS